MFAKIRRKYAWLLLLPLALLVRAYAAAHPEVTERVFATGLYPAIAAPISRVMGAVSFPVVLVLLVGIIAFAVHACLKSRYFRAAIACVLVAVWFLCGWSLNYYRLPLAETLQLPVLPSTQAELTALCEHLILQANADADAPDCAAPLAINAAMDAASAAWPIPAGQYGQPKYAPASGLLSRMRIEGITSPFTLEAMVNRNIPSVSQPFTACHEAAHLRGFAREEDANFIAYLACRASDDPAIRYSGAFSALLYALNALYRADAEAYYACAAALSDEVRADMKVHADYWRPFEQTTISEITEGVQEVYLHSVSSGEQSAQSYGKVVDLLLALERMEALP